MTNTIPNPTNGNITVEVGSLSARKGDIVRSEDGSYWKIAKDPSYKLGTHIFAVVPATAEQYAARPGRVAISSERELRDAVGSCRKTEAGEWVHIKRGVRISHGPGWPFTYAGIGVHVPAEKAAKLNAAYEKKMAPIRAAREAEATRYADIG